MKLEIMNVNVCVSHMHAPPPTFLSYCVDLYYAQEKVVGSLQSPVTL